MAQTHQIVLLGEGGRVTYNGAAVAAGAVVITNGMFQFATQDIPLNTDGTLRTASGPPSARGVKVNGAISVGNAIYWDAAGDPQGGTAGTGALTTTAGGNTLVGRAIAAAGATDETVDFELTIGVVTAGTTENAITDPGDAGAIPANRSGYVALVSGGVETRTLAAPATPGLQLLLYHKTDGGSVAITAAVPINQTGNTIMTLTELDDSIMLTSIESGATKEWRVMNNDGTVLS